MPAAFDTRRCCRHALGHSRTARCLYAARGIVGTPAARPYVQPGGRTRMSGTCCYAATAARTSARTEEKMCRVRSSALSANVVIGEEREAHAGGGGAMPLMNVRHRRQRGASADAGVANVVPLQ